MSRMNPNEAENVELENLPSNSEMSEVADTKDNNGPKFENEEEKMEKIIQNVFCH